MNVAPTTTSDTLSNLGLALRGSGSERTELGQDEFLKLMTTQLQNQDPFKPMESGEFLGQIAQFSTVSGIQKMQDSISGLSTALTSNQTLQAAGLVGHGVMVPGEAGYLFADGGLAGVAEVPASGELSIEITDASGQVVRRIDRGVQAEGNVSFAWDGLDEGGQRMVEGMYGVRATVASGGVNSSVSTQVMGLVNSVSLGSGGLSLNLFGMDPVSITEVREIL